ncbi:MAG TPA: hypothetical protein PKA77_15430 [Chitinophagaceae bacterium]|nr:hypothetical protein [Chitinophagaceae bacterium]HMU59609.1 hypothetical protein [Chitinophagaceae bacterium]
MKIASLLAHFLYTHKKLDLPGIGTFLLDTEIVTETENTKNKQVLLEGVSFIQNSATKEDAVLIDYISSHTGKIKPLASSDLESHLELAKQFINIGKPFLFDGIGTIGKINRNEYVFTPGIMITEPAQEYVSHETHLSHGADYPADYKEVFYRKKETPGWKRPMFFILGIAGIVLAVWGGYTVYKNSTADNESGTDVSGVSSQPVQTDTVTAELKPADTGQNNITAIDTALNTVTTPAMPTPSGSYKFVVETAERERALARFDKLKNSFKLPVLMETKDSLLFKIYFVLAANPADTLRMIDSLQRAYTPPGKRAYVE